VSLKRFFTRPSANAWPVLPPATPHPSAGQGIAPYFRLRRAARYIVVTAALLAGSLVLALYGLLSTWYLISG
jgi:hypothetical protein